MRLEVVVVPVSDVDRAKGFYKALGWREDADYAAGADFRVVQVTPPGSACPVIFGAGVTSADLAEALRSAAAAHGKHEEQIGHADPDWPDWYAQFMVQQEERPGRASPGAGT